MERHPLTPDYLDELTNVEMSRRIRLLLALIAAGEIDGAEANEIRRQPEPMKEAA